MIELEIPGFASLHLENLVLDYNGTLAIDGVLIPEVREKIRSLAAVLDVHVVTADTFGSAAAELAGLPCKLTVISDKGQDIIKREFIEQLGSDRCVCIGNGRNDREMLRTSALGISVIQREGASSESLTVADVICTSVVDALALLENPKRLIATLRS